MTNNDLAPKTLSLTYLILRYSTVMFLVGLLLVAVDFALQYFFQYQSSAGLGIVAAIVPALDAGQVFARRMGRVPNKGEAWRLSVILLVVNIAFGALLLLALTLIPDPEGHLREVFATLITPLGLGVLGVMLLIYLLATRYFFGSGAKGEIKRQVRMAAKQEKQE